MNKPRIVKDYVKLELETKEQLKLNYPHGFDKYLIRFKNIKNKFVSALPFETEDKYYLIRMTLEQAHSIIADDNDYHEGTLKMSVITDLRLKHEDDDDDDDIDELDDIIEEVDVDLSEEDIDDD